MRFYTRGLAPAVAERRIEEIDADLHDQVAHERAAGAGDLRIALAIASRTIRGVAADLAWRRRQPRATSTREGRMKPRTTLSRSAGRVALGVAAVLSLPLAAMLLSDQVVWSLADFVLAGVLLTTIGVVLELAARRRGNLAAATAVGALGVAAGVLGEADDAPGLVLLGILLVGSGLALAVRTARSRG